MKGGGKALSATVCVCVCVHMFLAIDTEPRRLTFSRSPFMALAVTATMGVRWFIPSRCRILSVACPHNIHKHQWHTISHKYTLRCHQKEGEHKAWGIGMNTEIQEGCEMEEVEFNRSGHKRRCAGGAPAIRP